MSVSKKGNVGQCAQKFYGQASWKWAPLATQTTLPRGCNRKESADARDDDHHRSDAGGPGAAPMTTTLAIETLYNGYRFRSRLEAAP
jgi:hypothetical protein